MLVGLKKIIIIIIIIIIGLSKWEAGKLANYVHMHPPTHLFKKTLLQRASLDRALDFLDPATDDIAGAPAICWSLQASVRQYVTHTHTHTHRLTALCPGLPG